MEGEHSTALARFRRQFGRPGSIAVRVYSCPGPCVGAFAVPGGFAVSDHCADLAAAVRHGVHSTLRSAGLYQAHGESAPERGCGWEGRTMAANGLLFPLTDRLCLPLMLLNTCCQAVDPQRRADSRRAYSEMMHTIRRRKWARERAQQLRQEGRAAEGEALERAMD